MRVVVFGASNDLGREVVTELVVRGHEVAAVIPASTPVPAGWDEQVRVMVGDVTETVTVSLAVEWSEVVINALDPRLVPAGSREALVDASARIVAAMAAYRVGRYIGFGSPVRRLCPRDVPTVRLRLNRWLAATMQAQEYRQMRGMLEAATTTDLDWTIVRFTHRSRRLNRGPSRGLKHVSYFAHEAVGSAATATDLARFAVDQVLDHRFIGAAPAVSC